MQICIMAYIGSVYYNPPGEILTMGRRLQEGTSYNDLKDSLRPGELLMAYFRSQGDDFDVATLIQSQERIDEISRGHNGIQYYAVDAAVAGKGFRE